LPYKGAFFMFWPSANARDLMNAELLRMAVWNASSKRGSFQAK